jgi:DHA2 family methylenomycin A resistance protein-like MFS transporter
VGGSRPRSDRLTLVATSLGYFVVILATTVVNVALTRIGADLGAGVSALQWVVDAYNLAFAGTLLTAGALGDRLGGRGVLAAGFAVFGAASLLSAAAPGVWGLAALQGVAGLGAAMVLPASLRVLSHSVAGTAARARSIAIWGGSGGAGIAVGPLAGGLLVGVAGWRAVFLLTGGLSLAGLALTLRCPAASASHPPVGSPAGLDLGGQALAMVTSGSVTFALIEGGDLGWRSAPVVIAFALAIAGAAAFLTLERRGRSPMLPLALFRAAGFSATAAVGLLLNLGLYGQIFVMALYFERVRGYSPLFTGLTFLPMTLTVVGANLLSGWLVMRSGPRALVVTGLLVAAAGLAALVSMGPATGYAAMVLPLIAVGGGWGLVVPALNTSLVGSVPPHRVGIAAGVFNTGRQVGGVVGVALFGSLLAGGSFVAGMRVALGVAAAALLVAGAIAVGLIDTRLEADAPA